MAANEPGQMHELFATYLNSKDEGLPWRYVVDNPFGTGLLDPS
jgi:hypothetical protein